MEAQTRQDAINDYYSGITTAERRGKAEGLAEGESKKARENAFAMLADGVPVGKVSLYTGLSIEEVKSLSRT
jgi:predicted transposase YdaD